MPEFLRDDFSARQDRLQDAGTVEHISALKRQYVRAREYCGFSLDDLINKPQARRLLRDVWLLGCMVRRPFKAEVLPPGNPFRGSDVLLSRPPEHTAPRN